MLEGKPSSFFLYTLLYIPEYLLQVLGTIIFGVGLWLAVDKHSLIALLKLVESERIEVSSESKEAKHPLKELILQALQP